MKNNFIIKILNWLKSTELFARPSQQIPAKWNLEEYYLDTDQELVHVTGLQLKEKKQFFSIEFFEDNSYQHQNNLKVPVVKNIQNGEWVISRNYIKLNSSEGNEALIEFQFAIVKEQLKLLKKDSEGRIEFFGIFHQVS